MKRLAGWRPSLRMAWRDARRSRGRSILVLVMIALPVLGVTAADIVIQTNDISGAEALDRRLGAADARVTFQKGVGKVLQSFDAEQWTGDGSRDGGAPGLAEVKQLLGPDVDGITLDEGSIRVRTDEGVGNAEATEVDLTSTLSNGLFQLESGRAPGGTGEVAINSALADRGFEVGDDLEVVDGEQVTVVGIMESTTIRNMPTAVGAPGSLGLSPRGTGSQQSFLIGAGPVSWDQVGDLNAIGGLVVSRAVLLDPPPESEIPEEIRSWSNGTDETVVAIAALIVVMALIEVVLLAGPAFAVGARRQARALALLAASGGTPRQARRVVLASGLVLGSLGAALGVLLGIGVAAAILPVLQRFSGSWFGPFDVPWLHLLGIAAFGMLSAFLAAVVPAWIASRQDVVAVLAGRRGDRTGGVRSPLVGALLLGAGVLGSAYGALGSGSGEILIAASAIPAVLGMILLVPLVLTGLARVSRGLPLTLRYAVRDAARHRTRTVPAVAAVAATVAGVVALGVANASDAAQSEASYTPSLPMGQASVTAWEVVEPGLWKGFRAAVDRELPDASVHEVRGVPESTVDGGFRTVSFRLDGDEVTLEGWTSSLGASTLVDEVVSDVTMPGLDPRDRARAQAALASGGAVLYSSEELPDQQVRIGVREYSGDGGRGKKIGAGSVAAVFVQPESGMAPGQAVLSPAAAAAVGAEPETVSLLITSGVTEEQEKDLTEALGADAEGVRLYVERGYTADDETLILLLVLGGLGGLLMLGGTLTATFLALSDARPDLATLSAVGATPRTRRGVAASYAVVVGLVGALLGAVIGFIPGIAITYPLTYQPGDSVTIEGSGYATATGQSAGPFLDVPWLLIGTLVLALPLLTALIVGLTARSRLPLVSRLD